MYILKNKDKEIASFDIINDCGIQIATNVSLENGTPEWLTENNFSEWLRSRIPNKLKLSKSLAVTGAASAYDCYSVSVASDNTDYSERYPMLVYPCDNFTTSLVAMSVYRMLNCGMWANISLNDLSYDIKKTGVGFVPIYWYREKFMKEKNPLDWFRNNWWLPELERLFVADAVVGYSSRTWWNTYISFSASSGRALGIAPETRFHEIGVQYAGENSRGESLCQIAHSCLGDLTVELLHNVLDTKFDYASDVVQETIKHNINKILEG